MFQQCELGIFDFSVKTIDSELHSMKFISRIMSILSFHFNILMILGIWCPSHWSLISKIAYKIYSSIVIVAMFSLGSFQFASLLLKSHDFKSFNDTFFIILTLIFACFKATCFLIFHEKVVKLLKMFEATCCVALDDFETDLRRNYDKRCRRDATVILLIMQLVALCFVLVPLFSESQELPYKVLLPYNISNQATYCLTYAHHVFVAFYLSAIATTSDLIIIGFMLHLCAQHQVLKHRLQQLPNKVIEAHASEAAALEKHLLKESVQHHVHIFDIAKMIAATFSVVTIGQFYVGTLEICLSVYQLSTRTRSVIEGVTYVMYIICMLGQLFFMCYFGNEVALQSKSLSSVIFGIDWTLLSVDCRKKLTIMILRSSKPIKIATGTFVRLSLESFVKVLKTSYSGFNILNSFV